MVCLLQRPVIIGASRREVSTEEYQSKIRAALDEFVLLASVMKKHGRRFKERFKLYSVDAQQESDFSRLNDHSVGSDNRDVVFYLATSPDLFGSICTSLAAHGLNADRMRVVLEKPLGREI